MGQPLRITFNNSDHVFQINNQTPINKATVEFEISVEGKTLTLVRDTENCWMPKEAIQEDIDEELIQAIGKTIALRYRI